MSADGSVVVGASHSENAGFEAFRWTRADGLQALGDLPGGPDLSRAEAVSADGSTIFGRGSIGDSALTGFFIWTPEEGIQQNAVVHESVPEDPEITGRVYFDVSENEGVRFGAQRRDGVARAFRWTPEELHVEIPALADIPLIESVAIASTPDGGIVVGSSGPLGWVWTPETGTNPLPPLSEEEIGVYPLDISADGSIIVGATSASTDPTNLFPGFIWTEELGTLDIHTYLEDARGVDLLGWTLNEVNAVSDDGSVLVGRGVNPLTGRPEAWLVDLSTVIPEPSSVTLLTITAWILGSNTRAKRHTEEALL